MLICSLVASWRNLSACPVANRCAPITLASNPMSSSCAAAGHSNAIKPNQYHRPIPRQQLGQPQLHVVQIDGPLGTLGLSVPVFLRELRCIAKTRVMHVGWRVIEAKGHRPFLTSRDQLCHDVRTVRSIRNLVVCVRGIEHAKAVVVFGSKYHVSLAGRASQVNESIRGRISSG